MTIYQTLVNKMMNSYNYWNFKVLHNNLLLAKMHDHQKLLDNHYRMIHEHEFRLKLMELFYKYEYRGINYYKILTNESELFLWNDHTMPARFYQKAPDDTK